MKSFKEYLNEGYADGEEVSMYVIRWVSQRTQYAFLHSNLNLYPQAEIYPSPDLIEDPIEYADIPVDAIAQVSYEGPTRLSTAKWYKEEVRDSVVTADIPAYDTIGKPIKGKYIYKSDTPIDLTDEEESEAVDLAVQQLNGD